MKTIKQSRTFNCTPHDAFELIMDSKKHSAFSGEKAVVSRKVGGKFKAYGDYISGKNLKIVQDKQIVQSWRASDWPKGLVSKVTFEFTKSGNGTKLRFIHEGVPEDQFDDLKQGWVDFYWVPMKKFLGER